MAKAFNLKNGTILLSTEAPGGLYNAAQLKKIASLCDGDMAIIKATEDQRLALFVKEDQAEAISADLQSTGLGIRNYQDGLHQPITCIGELCPDFEQDALGSAMDLTEKLSGVQLATSLKIGINGCGRCCVPCHTFDISVVGDTSGYRISIGGKNSQIPEMASFVAEGVPPDKLVGLLEKVVSLYAEKVNDEEEETLQDVVDRCGAGDFIAALAPWSQDAADDDDPFGSMGGDEPEAETADGAEDEAEDSPVGEDDAGMEESGDEDSFSLDDADELDGLEEEPADAAGPADDLGELSAESDNDPLLDEVETGVEGDSGETAQDDPLLDASEDDLELNDDITVGEEESGELAGEVLIPEDSDVAGPDVPGPNEQTAGIEDDVALEADLGDDPAEDALADDLEGDSLGGDDLEEDAVAAAPPKEAIADDPAEDSIGDDLEEDAIGDDIGDDLEEDAIGDDLAEDAGGDDPAEDTVGDDLEEDAIGDDLAEDAIGDDLAEDAIGDDLAEDAIGDDLEEDAIGDDLEEDAVPTEDEGAFEERLNASIDEEQAFRSGEEHDENSADRDAALEMVETTGAEKGEGDLELDDADLDDADLDDVELEDVESGDAGMESLDSDGDELDIEEERFDALDNSDLKPPPPSPSPEAVPASAAAGGSSAGNAAFEFSGVSINPEGNLVIQFSSGAWLAVDPGLPGSGPRQLMVGGRSLQFEVAPDGISMEIDGLQVFYPLGSQGNAA